MTNEIKDKPASEIVSCEDILKAISYLKLGKVCLEERIQYNTLKRNLRNNSLTVEEVLEVQEWLAKRGLKILRVK